ncbi:phosphatase PAP2 family protein [Sedimenticola sp.]|uniref:phosphatase PAP2 family protein n=1 Tax=Sedimenticola sp. TaxID=1940285 RepID=UPI003D0DA26B
MILKAPGYPGISRFFVSHGIVPLTLFILAAAWLETSTLDLRLAGYFYDPVSASWPWRHHWLTSDLLHTDARYLTLLIALLILGTAIASQLHPPWKRFRKATLFLCCGLLLGPVLVLLAKHITNIDCPWHLTDFGGTHTYLRLLETRPSGYGSVECFPAGHASSGYAFLIVYFFNRRFAYRFRHLGLLAGLAPGLVFGIAQQARGAHFFSHDLWSLACCWFSQMSVYLLFYRDYERRLVTTRGVSIPKASEI